MKKHKLNVFPEMNGRDFLSLVESMMESGYHGEPILLYEGDILDGWNRFRASELAEVTPTYEDFEGTPLEAMDEAKRRNYARRSMNSGQKACVAVLNDDALHDIADEVERERRRKQAESRRDSLSPKIFGDKVNDHSKETDFKLAELYDTNDRYIRQARYLKNNAYYLFEQVLNETDGMKLFRAYRDAKKAVVEIGEEVEEAFEFAFPTETLDADEEVDWHEDVDNTDIDDKDDSCYDGSDEEDDVTDVAIYDPEKGMDDYEDDEIIHRPDINEAALKISIKMVEMVTKIEEMYNVKEAISTDTTDTIDKCITKLYHIMQGE